MIVIDLTHPPWTWIAVRVLWVLGIVGVPLAIHLLGTR